MIIEKFEGQRWYRMADGEAAMLFARPDHAHGDFAVVYPDGTTATGEWGRDIPRIIKLIDKPVGWPATITPLDMSKWDPVDLHVVEMKSGERRTARIFKKPAPYHVPICAWDAKHNASWHYFDGQSQESNDPIVKDLGIFDPVSLRFIPTKTKTE